MSSSAPANPDRWRNRLVLICLYTILVIAALLSLIPFYWMIISSLKPAQDIVSLPVWLIPLRPTLENYGLIFNRSPSFLRIMFNSIFIASVNVLLQTLLCSLAGFAFAKYRFLGRNLLFTLVLATVMIPTTVQLIPNYIVMSQLKWVGTWLP